MKTLLSFIKSWFTKSQNSDLVPRGIKSTCKVGVRPITTTNFIGKGY